MLDKFVGYSAFLGLILGILATLFYILVPSNQFVEFVMQRFIVVGGTYSVRGGGVFTFLVTLLPIYGIILGGIIGYLMYLIVKLSKKVISR